MRTVEQVFSGTLPLAISGKLLRIIEASAPVDVTIYSDSGQSVAAKMSSGYYSRPAGGFSRVDFYSETSVSIKVLISDDDGGVDVVSVVGRVMSVPVRSTKIVDMAAASVGTIADKVIDENLSRVEIRFKNDSDAAIYLGGSGVSKVNSPIKLEPGQMWIEDAAAAARWYAVADGAGKALKIQAVE